MPTKISSKQSLFFIRSLQAKDLARVNQIEQAVYPIPWTQGIHQDCVDSKYPSLVLEDKQQIIGYAVFNYLLDECHLLNIAIAPEFQDQGYATKLLHAMELRAQEAGMQRIILEVRASNNPAIQFYKKEAFEQIGLRKKYYKALQGREDAIVMSKALS